MGYKSRGNFALSLKISQEEFDNIFKKEEKKEEEVKPNKGCKYCNGTGFGEIYRGPEDGYKCEWCQG